MALPLREIVATGAPDVPEWWARIPAVRQVLAEGWKLDPITVVVGDNGAGKSTLVEAVAVAFGMGPEGGAIGSGYTTRASESPLDLAILRGIGAGRRGFFLRAETMHAFYSYLEENPGNNPNEARFHEMSHGESFLTLVGDRMVHPGLYVLDEPESALSFDNCLALVAKMRGLADNDSQVLLSTHSPVLAAVPGAAIWEVGEWGMRRCEWEDLDLVRRWRGFLDDPGRFLRYFLD